MELTKSAIVDFLRDELGLDTATVTEETPLFSSGMIDSFSLVSLIMHLESKGGFRMQPMDITLDNLDTVGRMLRFVSTHVNGSQSLA